MWLSVSNNRIGKGGLVASLFLSVACSNTETHIAPGDLGAATTCVSTTALQVVFSPMYSAYESTHKYQIPAIVTGIDANLITWTSSNTSVATVVTDTVVGGAMLTMTGAGTTTVTAQAGDLCGTSTLTVDEATAALWSQGSDRYNNGVVYSRSHSDMGLPDGSSTTDPACTNCHGPTSTNPRYKDIAHTPEQIGGFSDTVLANIMQNGVVPDGGYFDSTIVSYPIWQSFHHWQLTQDDVNGVIVYLRSLTPTSQTGTSNFGGYGPPGDGGYPRRRPDMAP